MKNLFIGRHGDNSPYGEYDFLTPMAIEQIEKMALVIRSLCEGNNTKILCSPKMIARRTAKAIADVVFIKIKVLDLFFSSYGRDPEIGKALDLITSTQCDNLIIVTHSEYMYELPEAFAAKILNQREWFFPSVEKGEFWHFNCEAMTYSHLQNAKE